MSAATKILVRTVLVITVDILRFSFFTRSKKQNSGPIHQYNTRAPQTRDSRQITTDLVEWQHDIHHFAHQHLKVASDQMQAHYDQLANSSGFQEGGTVWLYHPIWKRGKAPKPQTCWEGPYIIITRINDVIYQIQRHPRAKMMVIHLYRLASYLEATQDEQPWGGSSVMGSRSI